MRFNLEFEGTLASQLPGLRHYGPRRTSSSSGAKAANAITMKLMIEANAIGPYFEVAS